MRVFVTGANGFIGRYVTAKLLAEGHRVIAAVRRPEELEHRFPQIKIVFADLNAAVLPDDWQPLLGGCDAIVNCAGLLQDAGSDRLQAVHIDAPKAMFDAAVALGINRIVHVSAISAEPEAGTDYASTKHACDQHLQSLDVDWVIVRPSLVYGVQAYGGTSLMRAFAALPWVLPLIGKGDQIFQPIFVKDLADAVHAALTRSDLARTIVEPVGPQRLTYKEILAKMRAWLGLPQAHFVTVPDILLRPALWLGDRVKIGPLNSTSLRQIEFGNAAPVEPFTSATGIKPLSMDEAFAQNPSFAQEIWHARLYFLKPTIRFVLALMWLLSGLIGLFTARDISAQVAGALGVLFLAPALTLLTCALDIGIGWLLLTQRLRHVIGALQLGVILFYTVALTLFLPGLWLEPLGPLLKNVPIFVLVLVSMAIDQDR